MITILDELDRLTAILANDESDALPYTANKASEKLNDAYKTYSFRVIPNHEDSRHVVGGHKVIARDQDGVLQPYIIKTVEDVEDLDGFTKEVYAEHISLELNGVIIRPQSFPGVTAEQFISQVISGSRWKIGVVEWFGTQDIEFTEHTSGIDAIIQAAQAFGGEFSFRAEMSNGILSGLYIDLVERRGEDTGIQILHEHNMTSIKRIEDTSEVYTALIGVARGEDGEGYTTFTSVTAADKPAGQDWIASNDALQNFGIIMPNGERMHYFGVYLYEGNERITPELLLVKTRQRLKEVSSSKFTYECTLADLSQITGYDHERFKLGDTISILNTDFVKPLLVEARIIEFEKGDDPEDSSVVLGYYRDIWNESAIAQIESLRNTVLREAGQWEQGGIGEEQVDGIARAASYRVDRDQISQLKTTLDNQTARVTASPNLNTQTVIDRVNNAKVVYDARFVELDTAITNAIVDDNVTPEEDQSIQDVRSSFVLAEAELSAALQEAESDITTNTEQNAVGAAEEAAQTTVTQYAERKIYRGIDPPTDPAPVKDDLWIDITDPANPIWMQYDGAAWQKMTRTNLSEMLGTLKTEQISDVSITTAKLVDDAITEAKMATNAVGLGQLQTGSVNNSKLVDLSIEAAKLAAGSVISDKLAPLSVGTTAIQDLAIVNGKISNLAVGLAQLQDASVGSAKIASLAVGTAALQDASITNAKVGSMDAAKLTTGFLLAARLASNIISSDKLAANSVIAGKLASNSVVAGTVAAGAVTSDSLAANSVIAGKVGANAITANELAANSVQTNHISAAGIDAGVLMAGTVISEDITFTGTLSGATGDFSGAVTSSGEGPTTSGSYFRRGTLDDGYMSIMFEEYGPDGAPLYNTYATLDENSLRYSLDNRSGWFLNNAILLNDNEDIFIYASTTGSLSDPTYQDVRIRNLIAEGNAADVTALYSRGMADIAGTAYIREDAAVYGRLRGSSSSAEVLVNGTYTDQTESGICGVGSMQNGAANSGAMAGVYVQFRHRKSYTPSSIAISGRSSNLSASTQVAVTDITNYGFWIYLLMSSGQTTFRYWRGSYTA